MTKPVQCKNCGSRHLVVYLEAITTYRLLIGNDNLLISDSAQPCHEFSESVPVTEQDHTPDIECRNCGLSNREVGLRVIDTPQGIRIIEWEDEQHER